MRLCRISLDGLVLLAFYGDDHVIPLDQAAEAYADETGVDLALCSSESLLDFLPPDGAYHQQLVDLSHWVEELDVVSRETLATPVDEVELLTPIARPNKLVLLAGNYAAHVVERGGTTAERSETFPYLFLKPVSTCLADPNAPIILPKVSPHHIDWECELGVVIGRACRHVDEADALEHVAGYTVVNDISDRKFKPNPTRKPRERDVFFDWQHGKWHDGFCTVGPCVASASAVPDPQTLGIKLSVNGEVKQDGSTAQMVFPVAAVVSFVSRIMTLEPGDIISTGTPSGVGSASGTYLRSGDVVRATIERIGTLENRVVADET